MISSLKPYTVFDGIGYARVYNTHLNFSRENQEKKNVIKLIK